VDNAQLFTDEGKMKILIGYDGSKVADEALRDLRRAGLPDAAQAFVLTAVPPMLPMESVVPYLEGSMAHPMGPADSAQAALDQEEKAREVAAKGAAALAKIMPGWAVASGTCVDTPAHGILEQAETWKPDLTVLGSHGWSGFSRLIIGSVADQVLRHGTGNLRISRKPDYKRTGAPKLLIGYDGSAHAEAAVAEVARRTWPKGTRVHILAAASLNFKLGDLAKAVKKTLRWNGSDDGPWPWMERALDNAAVGLQKRGFIVTPMIRVADPRNALVEEALEMGADCIFVGSRGLSGPKRFLVGSVSSGVAAHAPCTVEVIHAPTPPAAKSVAVRSAAARSPSARSAAARSTSARPTAKQRRKAA